MTLIGNNVKLPELETGRNSKNPWIAPTINNSIRFIPSTSKSYV